MASVLSQNGLSCNFSHICFRQKHELVLLNILHVYVYELTVSYTNMYVLPNTRDIYSWKHDCTAVLNRYIQSNSIIILYGNFLDRVQLLTPKLLKQGYKSSMQKVYAHRHERVDLYNISLMAIYLWWQCISDGNISPMAMDLFQFK
jgi:hypothetical protein